LSQFNNKGIKHHCAYASRVLTQAEASYSPCHLEASGLEWSTRHFRPYLIGRHFTIRIDQKPLVSMNKTHSLALDRIYAELIETFFLLVAFCDISHRLGGITPFSVFSNAFPGLKMWVTFACATANCLTHFIISIAVLKNVPPDAGLQKRATFPH
jgi:hypothetical protein